VLARGGDIRLEGVEIAANTAARSGGGVLVEGGTASVLKATLHGDGAGQAGGAIAVLGAGSAQIDSATIIGNSAAGFAGGGVFFGGAWAASDLSRSIGAGNAAAQGADVALVGGAWGGADNLFGVAALTDGRPRHEIPAGMAQALADDAIAPGAVFDAIEPVTGGGQAGMRQAAGETVAPAAGFDKSAIDALAAYAGVDAVGVARDAAFLDPFGPGLADIGALEAVRQALPGSVGILPAGAPVPGDLSGGAADLTGTAADFNGAALTGMGDDDRLGMIGATSAAQFAHDGMFLTYDEDGDGTA